MSEGSKSRGIEQICPIATMSDRIMARHCWMVSLVLSGLNDLSRDWPFWSTENGVPRALGRSRGTTLLAQIKVISSACTSRHTVPGLKRLPKGWVPKKKVHSCMNFAENGPLRGGSGRTAEHTSPHLPKHAGQLLRVLTSGQ